MATAIQAEEQFDQDIKTESSPDNLPKHLKDALLTIVQHYREEDKEDRELLLPKWRRNELYWRGVQDLFWSDIIQDWRTISEEAIDADVDEEEYNSIVNIYKAYGEIIIAALLAGYPKTHYFPGNANKIEDIITSREFNKLGGLIAKWNNTEFLLYHALYILYTQDFVASYTYYTEDKEFGTRRVPIMGKTHTVENISVCINCEQETPEDQCPECGAETVVIPQDREVEAPIDEEEQPKGRQIMEVYGPLNVAVPHYVKHIRQAPYIRLETEEHVSHLKEIYPGLEISSGPDNKMEAEYRAPIPGSATKRGLKTTERWWFQPWAFNTHTDEAVIEELKALYPEGAYVVVIDNDKIAETMDEDMKKCWTISRAPLSSHIHSPALGDSLIPIQDMRNDLVYISLDTAKRGIGETFADMGVIDWDVYDQHRAKVGVMFPAKRRKDENLSNSFFQMKNATLSEEVGKFFGQLDSDAALMTRAYPPIYGGGVEGSHTLGEYDIRRSQSLQSLSIPWKILNWWYAESMENAVRIYKEYMVEDESYVTRQGGRYQNVQVSRENLDMGQLGQVMPEVSEKFPTSWAERKATLMELIQLNNEAINTALFSPENIPTTTQIIGIDGIKVPGEADREKQLAEIAQLLLEEPIGDDMTGEMQSSIPVEPEIDDHTIQKEICRSWALSEEGQEAKISNPAGYMNVILHMQMHSMIEAQMQQEQMMMEAQAQAMGSQGAAPEAPPQRRRRD